jgi:hypothetical protein
MISFSELSIYYKAGKNMQVLRFLQRCTRGFHSSGAQTCVSEHFSDILTPDNENKEWLHNTGNETGSNSRKTETLRNTCFY